MPHPEPLPHPADPGPRKAGSYRLFYLLNTNLVRRQLAAKTIVQGTIATLGSRLPEVELPLNRDKAEREARAAEVAAIIEGRTAAQTRIRKLLADSP